MTTMFGLNSLTRRAWRGGMTSPQLIEGSNRPPEGSVTVTPSAGQAPLASFSTC
jgi:hypothetical protein